MFQGYDKLAIPLPSGTGADQAWLLIAPASSRFNKSFSDCDLELADGWLGKAVANTTGPDAIAIKDHGSRIRLLETTTYRWVILSKVPLNAWVKSDLEDARAQRWSVDGDDDGDSAGQFCVINHLGFSKFSLIGPDQEALLELPLEFVSKKLDFDTEYRHMTEGIAKFCEQLLLQWQAPTSLRFSSNPSERARLLLERFLFLRHFLTDDRLASLLEVIERNPHSLLRAEKEWKPAAMARSTDFLSNPSAMLRGWHRQGGRPVPSEVLDVRKEDTHDTAPNRFIKFALAQFRQLCSDVIEVTGEDSSVGAEALELQHQIDAILSKRFFLEISRLNRLPLDNQTLQKGEGYREVLRAWLLTEAAASLNWKGQEESYRGSTRDVATLYEYWIFIQLHTLLEKDIDGMEKISGESITGDDVKSFISEDGGEIKIHLSSGEQSRASFLLNNADGENLRIDLHYERTFSKSDKATSGASYSRQFRPDYTLSLFPARYETEAEAEKSGKVAHLHFDAKYRAAKIKEMFGDISRDEESISSEKIESKAISTYQRGDLLKMHTYNDALRQTIGSYVLYPGDTEDKTELRKFHEIAPGVGALVMKPGNTECLNTLKAFLTEVFSHQSSQFTQQRYMADTRYKIIEQEHGTLKEDNATYFVARKNAPCVLVWLKKAAADIFREHGFAYCHATPDLDKSLSLNLSVEIGSEFIPCGGAQGQPIKGLGWRAKITSARFMSKEKLSKFIKEKGLSEHLKPSSVKHYLVYEFKEATTINTLNLDAVHKKHRAESKYMAVSCKWQEILDSQTNLE